MPADDETDHERPGRRGRRLAVAGALLAVWAVVAAGAGLWSLLDDDDPPLFGGRLAEQIPPEAFVDAVARRWAAAWAGGDTVVMAAIARPPAKGLAEAVMAFGSGLGVTALQASPGASVIEGRQASVPVEVVVDVDGVGSWRYSTEVALVLPPEARASAWQVDWSPAALHPAITDDLRLSVHRELPPRAALLAADGTPLSGPGADPPRGLAVQLIGRLGSAEAAGEHRRPGDLVGVSGLHAAFDDDLGGSPSGEVRLVDATGAVVAVLDRIEGRPSADVRTSIDLEVQRTAESVLGGVDGAAALVAVRPSTGEVLASVSHPVQGFNRALQGRYPPGSTFKVVTTAALLASGTTPDTPTSCPEVARVGGREFRNAEGAALGDIPFRRAFYESCNTAFVQLSTTIEGAALVAAAERFGLNVDPPLEVPAMASSFPEPGGAVDQASAAIGQGRVLVTPLQMASVAATVAAGAHRPLTVRAVEAPVPGDPLDPSVAGPLQELMRLVVAQGTGTRAQLPPPPVGGKTGTAEFGTERPPRTHAWFIGFRGDLAVAVVVEDADGFGGTIAAPLAREVLRLGR
ncbi:MAG TPA: penicillin-binding transpeptidase domain-containing protein [Acidimicrobiales bacterium]|nr:penicillin-binding transpeptidase domain-containing protein [Acidimicrobiales bacterium]